MRHQLPSPLSTPRIDQIWCDAARSLDFQVSRTAETYASSDGKGTISIGISEILDIDDSFAQLVFHELCHALVQGPARQQLPDWGLAPTGGDDIAQEHACLRVQAHLARPHGLRELMAPTTEYRPYHDALPIDVLAEDDDPAVAIAAAAIAGAIGGAQARWGQVLSQALAATTATLGDAASVQRHPLGFALGPAAQTCGSCAWFYVGGRGPAVERCRQAMTRADADSAARTQRQFAACERWEKPVDCQACGACCREAYHVVSVSMRDPVVWRQPDFIVRRGHRFEVLRAGERCAALSVVESGAVSHQQASTTGDTGPAKAATHYGCRIYEDRPQTCRDFTANGHHCLEARRRVGLSR
jgi:hypothetical protein